MKKKCKGKKRKKNKKEKVGGKKMRWPGVEPGSIAWKATMLTVTPPTLACVCTANCGYLKLRASGALV